MSWPIHPLQTVSTAGFWQNFGPTRGATPHNSYDARLPDGRVLQLPVRRLARQPGRAMASLISNQTSFAVEEALAQHMATLARLMSPDVIVGMPTLGLVYAASVARLLGCPNYVPLGYSRKFWYDDALAEPVHSVTTPDQIKTVYLDPNLIARLQGRRVLVIDDVVSSGTTTLSVVRLLRRAGIEPIGLVAAMLQGDRWRSTLEALAPGWSSLVRAVLHSPILVEGPDGWRPLTAPDEPPAQPPAPA